MREPITDETVVGEVACKNCKVINAVHTLSLQEEYQEAIRRGLEAKEETKVRELIVVLEEADHVIKYLRSVVLDRGLYFRKDMGLQKATHVISAIEKVIADADTREAGK